MPSPRDQQLVERFVEDAFGTCHLIAANARLLAEDRPLLLAAIGDLQDWLPRRMMQSYMQLSDREAGDAGVSGQQLETKVEMTASLGRRFAGRLWQTGAAREWVKRAKVLVDSLKSTTPGAEALSELLSLLDSGLSSARRA